MASVDTFIPAWKGMQLQEWILWRMELIFTKPAEPGLEVVCAFSPSCGAPLDGAGWPNSVLVPRW